MSLITQLNLKDHDALYERLIAAHEGLSEAESAALNARLVLILMNHIGERDVLDAAFDLATRAGSKEGLAQARPISNTH